MVWCCRDVQLRCVIQPGLIILHTNSFTLRSFKLHFNKSTLTFGLVWDVSSGLLGEGPVCLTHPPTLHPPWRTFLVFNCVTWRWCGIWMHLFSQNWNRKFIFVTRTAHNLKVWSRVICTQNEVKRLFCHRKIVLYQRNRSVNSRTNRLTVRCIRQRCSQRFLPSQNYKTTWKKNSNKTFTDPNMRCWTESKGETYRNSVSTLENTPLNIYDLMTTLLAYSFTLIHPKQDVS